MHMPTVWTRVGSTAEERRREVGLRTATSLFPLQKLLLGSASTGYCGAVKT
jgi:hypothetical protein